MEKIIEGAEDYFRAKGNHEMRFRRVEVAFDLNATKEISTGSKYIPLELSRDPQTYDPRFEMAGLVVIDYDDFRRAEELNLRSTRRDIKEGLILYCQKLGAIKGKMELSEFIYSESSDVFVADFKAYLRETLPPVGPEDLSKFITF